MEPWISAAVSEIGLRGTNEDSFLEAPDLRLWAVADGMGGHSHGEVASRTAVRALKHAVLEGEDLPGAVAAANRATWREARHRASDMGTTLVALRLHTDRWELSWLGDSRAYRWSNGRLERLSRDHTLVQQWVEQGRISAGEARNHPYGHVLTQAAGLEEQARTDSLEGPLTGSEVFLLCSDGLTDTLGEERIAEVLDDMPPADPARALADAALAADNPFQDNLTVVVIRRHP
ncbi:PP2C family protein-serine/threonine phosphatase [Thiohalorhabdus sp. Cl-TMA]|uniref:PP2C family serine/threonine-protein phosphatase n=1 Tax=Thiohalorhabdus methylotrophus TaxID=3242694 RepID=A0ABV4TUC9_9GAMM